MKFLVFLFAAAPMTAFAGFGGFLPMDGFDCNEYLSQQAQMAQGFGTEAKPAVTFQNGELKVDRSSPNFKGYEKKGSIETVEFQSPEYNMNGITGRKVRTKFVFEKTEAGYKIRNDFDDAAAKRSWDEMQKFMRENKGGMGFGMGGFGMAGFGTITEMDTALIKTVGSNQCEVDQASTTSLDFNGQGKMTTVFQDKKFCDSVKNQLKALGKENFEKCERNMQSISDLMNKRVNELAGEKKILFANGLNAYSLVGVSWGLRSCAPAEWARFSNPGLESVPDEHLWNTPGKLDAAEAAQQQQRSTVPGGTR